MLAYLFSRDSWLWLLAFIAAVLAYLSQTEAPPWEWAYQQWIQFGTIIVSYLLGKMGTSPRPGAPKNNVVDVSKLNLLLVVALALPLVSSCTKQIQFTTNPVGATAHYATQVTLGVKGIQSTVISAEAAGWISTDKAAEVVKVTVQFGQKAAELATALLELDKLPLADYGRQPIVGKIGLILGTANELLDKLKLGDYFLSLPPDVKQRVHALLTELGNLLLRIAQGAH